MGPSRFLYIVENKISSSDGPIILILYVFSKFKFIIPFEEYLSMSSVLFTSTNTINFSNISNSYPKNILGYIFIEV